MKGLFIAFGLIAALFISNVNASIYDTATSHPPEFDLVNYYNCGSSIVLESEYDQCMITFENYVRSVNPTYNWVSVDCNHVGLPSTNILCTYSWSVVDNQGNTSIANSSKLYPRWQFHHSDDSATCPPNQFPNYIFAFDLNGDGQPEKCYDPLELDNVSKCADLFNSGSVLSTGSNVAPLVCKVFEDGSRCAFSRVNQGTTPYYQPNLEESCFGDGDLIPEYDPDPNDPQPQPEQCVPYAGGYACAADPNNYCSSEFECVDGCGYFNGQFICFRDEQCTGASCEPAPVDCTTVPDAPVCKDKETTPEPTFCEKNPTVQACQGGSDFCKQNPLAPSCQLGGGGTGGVSSFSLDYDKLINGMKDAAKLIIDPSETPEFSEFKTEIDDKTSELDSDIDGFMNGSHFDGINDQIGSNPFTDKFQLPSGGGCTAFELGGHPLDLCDAAQKISSVLYFVFAFLTLLHLKHLFFSTITPRKE